jgi:hypothetical protein
LERCRHPCVLGTDRCIQHQHIESFEDPQDLQKEKQPNEELTNEMNQPKESKQSQETKPIRLIRLEANSTDPAYWCDRETGFVYISSGKIIGKYIDG